MWSQSLGEVALLNRVYSAVLGMKEEQQQPGPRFVLALGGSFNPVHVSHVDALERAKAALESIFPGSVVAGHLALAHGSHVRSKCGAQGAMTKGHRLAMCSLAVAGSDWLKASNQCFASALCCLETIYGRDDSLILVDVVGGDRAKPSRRTTGKRASVLVARAGSEEKKAEFEKRIQTDEKSRHGLFHGKPAPPGVLISGSDLFITEKADRVSSTRIRQVMCGLFEARDKRAALDVLVEENVLAPVVADYIAEHWDTLFEA